MNTPTTLLALFFASWNVDAYQASANHDLIDMRDYLPQTGTYHFNHGNGCTGTLEVDVITINDRTNTYTTQCPDKEPITTTAIQEGNRTIHTSSVSDDQLTHTKVKSQDVVTIGLPYNVVIESEFSYNEEVITSEYQYKIAGRIYDYKVGDHTFNDCILILHENSNAIHCRGIGPTPKSSRNSSVSLVSFEHNRE